jgi:hypothetical protein
MAGIAGAAIAAKHFSGPLSDAWQWVEQEAGNAGEALASTSSPPSGRSSSHLAELAAAQRFMARRQAVNRRGRRP